MQVVGVVAVERDPGPHQVEVVLRAEKRRRGVREARPGAGKGVADRPEPFELAAICRRRRLVRTGEVAHQQRHVEPGAAGLIGEQRIELGRIEAEPMDAGLDVERRTGRRTVRRGARDPSIDAVGVEQARNQVMLAQHVRLVAGARHEHEDVHVAEDAPQIDRLAGERGEEGPAAGRVQSARNLRGTQSVPVRLDHPGDLGGCRRSNGAPVRGQGGKIHDEPGRGASPAVAVRHVHVLPAHGRTPLRTGRRSPWRPRVHPASIPPGPSRTSAEPPHPRQEPCHEPHRLRQRPVLSGSRSAHIGLRPRIPVRGRRLRGVVGARRRPRRQRGAPRPARTLARGARHGLAGHARGDRARPEGAHRPQRARRGRRVPADHARASRSRLRVPHRPEAYAGDVHAEQGARRQPARGTRDHRGHRARGALEAP